MAIAFVFPGQGSQAVGMGKELAAAYPEARAVFEEVDAALGQRLSSLMFEGPLETLTLTENTQPALLAAGVAALHADSRDRAQILKHRHRFVERGRLMLGR